MEIMPKRSWQTSVFILTSVLLLGALAERAFADSITVGFEAPGYSVGSISGQNGWGGQNPPGIAVNPSIDQGVVSSGLCRTGSQCYRESSFFTSGSFGDQVFSPSLTQEAGEPGSIDGGFSAGPPLPRFTSTVFFRSQTGAPQDGHVVVSPDRGDGARMSWIQVSDNLSNPQVCIGGTDWGNSCTTNTDCASPGVCTADGRAGLSVSFYDYRLPNNPNDCDGGPTQVDTEGKCFVFKVLATNLSRTAYHRIDLEMELYAGKANDVVRVGVDGGTPFRGTSWEDYFPNNQDPPFTGHPPTVDSLLFRVGGDAEGSSGAGFLFDDVSYASTACSAATRFVSNSGDDTFNDCRDSGSPCETIQHAVDVACSGDTVNAAAGTYTEQVTIEKSLTVTGAGASTTKILAPPTLPPNSGAGTSDIVQIDGSGVSVNLSGFTVSGPGPSGCGSIRAGVEVFNGATASIHNNTIADVRDQPLSGCQNGVAIIVGSSSTSASATITSNSLHGYQKNAMVIEGAGTTATVTGNTAQGVGNTTLIAQNGIQVSDGALATVSGNTVSDHRCDHSSCGSDFVNDYQSIGILIFDAASGTSVSGNTVSSNDLGIYNLAEDPTTISDNEVTSNRFEGIVLDQGDAAVTGNTVQGGNIAVLAVSFDASFGTTGNSQGTLTCNRISGAGTGIELVDSSLSDSFIPVLDAHNNSVSGNSTGANNTTSASMDFTANFWGCSLGPGNVGCDSTAGNLVVFPVSGAPAACVPGSAVMHLTKVKVKRDTGTVHHNGTILVQGDFLTSPPGDTFNPASQGVKIRVQDSLHLDLTSVTWSGTQCKPPTTLGVINCTSPDKSATAQFKPLVKPYLNTTPNQDYRFTFRLKRLAGITSPFQSPAQVTLTEVGPGLDRFDSIQDCSSTISGILCREF